MICQRTILFNEIEQGGISFLLNNPRDKEEISKAIGFYAGESQQNLFMEIVNSHATNDVLDKLLPVMDQALSKCMDWIRDNENYFETHNLELKAIFENHTIPIYHKYF